MTEIAWISRYERLPRVNPHLFVLTPNETGEPFPVSAARLHNEASIDRWAPLPIGRPMLIHPGFQPVFDMIADKMRAENADRIAIRFDILLSEGGSRCARPRGVRLYDGNTSVNKLRQFTASLELCRLIKKKRPFVEALAWICTGRTRFSLFVTKGGHYAIFDGETIHPLRFAEDVSGHDALAWAEAFAT